MTRCKLEWNNQREIGVNYGDGIGAEACSAWVSIVDITKRKEAEEEARRQREQINLLRPR